MLRHASGAVGTRGMAAAVGVGLWRTVASKAKKEVLHNSMSDFYDVGGAAAASGGQAEDARDRPLSADPGVRHARKQQQTSIMEPPLLHDSLSGADYGYPRRPSTRTRMSSSITEPDYYLQNSMSEGQYDMPMVLQRGAARSSRRGQGFSTAKQLPTMQRIVVVNRAAAQDPEPLHNSFSHGDYPSK